MLYELASEAVRFGDLPLAGPGRRQSAGDERPWRRRLLGSWRAEFGIVNRVATLSRLEMPDPPGAEDEEVSRSSGAGARQAAPETTLREAHLLNAETEIRDELADRPFVELRRYTIDPGAIDEFMALMRAALPAREKYSQKLGVWTPLTGNRDEVFHMWAYTSLEERERARAMAKDDPVWKAYLDQISPLVRTMTAELLRPVARR
mgnify:CR=1 FL=1